MSNWEKTTVARRKAIKGINSLGRISCIEDTIQQNKQFKHCLKMFVGGNLTGIYILDESWDGESYMELASAMTVADASYSNNELRAFVREYNDSASFSKALEEAFSRGNTEEQTRTYVKASKVRGKADINMTLKGVMYDVATRINILKGYTTLDFSKTSAILYHGQYICPCSLEYEAMKAFNCTRSEAKKLIEIFLKEEGCI